MDMIEGRDAVAQTLERISNFEKSLMRDVYLFDPNKSGENCHQYIFTLPSGIDVPLFEGGYRDLFERAHRLSHAIEQFELLPKLIRCEFDIYWDSCPGEDSEFEGVNDAILLVLDRLFEYLVQVAGQNSFDASVIARCGKRTENIIGQRSARRKLWGQEYYPAAWPHGGLEFITAQNGFDDVKEITKELLAGAAEISCMKTLVDRWRAPVTVRVLRDTRCVDGKTVKQGTVFNLNGTLVQSWLDAEHAVLASEGELEIFKALMRAIEQNERDTAADELSQTMAADAYEQKMAAREERQTQDSNYKPDEEIPPPDAAMLIVRFLRLESAGGRSFSIGEVYPVKKERALALLLNDSPVVELASPEELKRDLDLVDQLEGIRKEWDRKRIPGADRLVQVRFIRRGKNPENRHSCDPGEIWNVGFDTAYLLARGREPLCEVLGSINPDHDSEPPISTRKPRKSFSKGEAQIKLIAAISNHHKYGADNLKLSPIGCNLLKVAAEVSQGAASKFFKSHFGSHADYVSLCEHERELLSMLTKLNDEYGSPKNRPLRDDA